MFAIIMSLLIADPIDQDRLNAAYEKYAAQSKEQRPLDFVEAKNEVSSFPDRIRLFKENHSGDTVGLRQLKEEQQQAKAQFEAVKDPNYLATIKFSLGDLDGSRVGFIGYDVICQQIAGPEDMIIRTSKGDIWVWVTGVPTKGFADDEKYDLSEYAFLEDGSKTYTTAIGGTKTVRVLRALGGKREFFAAVRQHMGDQSPPTKQKPPIDKADRKKSMATDKEKIESSVRTKIAAAESKMRMNDYDAAEKYAKEAAKQAEGTSLEERAKKLVDDVKKARGG